MRRAVLISVLLHFAVLLSFMSDRIDKAWSPSNGTGSLVATLRPGAMLPERQAKTGEVAVVRQPARVAPGRRYVVSKPDGRHFNLGPKFQSTGAAELNPVRGGETTGLAKSGQTADYPVELEVEYRLELARMVGQERGSWPSPGRPGTVVISLAQLPGRIHPAVAVAQGSGDPGLDRLALHMLSRAIVQAEVPASLRSQNFRILLPIEFRTDE